MVKLLVVVSEISYLASKKLTIKLKKIFGFKC
jgi:hypothetical protein